MGLKGYEVTLWKADWGMQSFILQEMGHDWLFMNIFGINKPSKDGDESAVISEDDIIGIDAFTYQDTNSGEIMTEAYDLIITTSN